MDLTKELERRWQYTWCGVFLGVLAPLGWILFRLMLFWDPKLSLFRQISGDILRNSESMVLYGYMTLGTGAVFAFFGYFLGRNSEQIHERAERLDELNRTVKKQKDEYEQRFKDLNNAVKNSQIINARLQKTLQVRDIYKLSAAGLQEIIGFDRVNVLTVDGKKKTLELILSRTAEGESEPGLVMPLGEAAGVLNKVVLEKESCFIDDISRYPSEYQMRAPCDRVPQLRSRSFIVCPIIVWNEVVALLGIDNKESRTPLGETAIDTVRIFAEQISTTLTKISLIEAVDVLTRELERTFTELLGYREEHARHDLSLHRATGSTTQSIGAIVRASDVIRNAVLTTRSAAGEMSASIEQVAQNLGQLSEFTENSISSMTEIAAAIRSMEENGVRSLSMSETVKQNAEAGARSVGDTLEGLKQIENTVEAAVAAIERLAEKGEAIGHITEVITEITQKTNLLALNAAIIAAQSGEHGRSFAVVAEEIRNLSQEASTSTSAINRLVEEIQTFTLDTVDQIGKTRDQVREGISRGAEMETSLHAILQSSTLAMDMANEIRRGTRESTLAVDSISRSIEDLGEMSSQLSSASREQALGTQNIVRSIDEIQSMAEDLVRAGETQQMNTMQIEGAVTLVSNMVKTIFSEISERKSASREIIERLELIKEIGKEEH